MPVSIVVEPQEEALYRAAHPEATIRVLPFANLGLGSIPARNWVWDDSRASGATHHWILDDNITNYWWRDRGNRKEMHVGAALAYVEDFVDAYANIGLAGHNYGMFAPDNHKMAAVRVNAHVYSSILLRNDLPVRWRGRYNEDTDLCLQIIARGLCIVQISAILAQKIGTMSMKGGNTTELYKGDGRLYMAQELQRRWPQIVSIRRRFGRPQHVINWSRLRGTLIKRDTTPDGGYGE